jgi:hypothetical protein
VTGWESLEGMRRLLGFVVVLALLLIAVDRLAWWGAERGLAVAIQDSQHLTERPDVYVEGFPFLTQAVRGRYDQVDGTIHDLTVDRGVTISELAVQLRGVHVGLGELLRQEVTSAPVDAASAQALVGYGALDAAVAANLSSDALHVRFGPGKNGLLAVTGTFDNGTISARLNGQARLTAEDGDLVVGLQPDSLGGVPAVIRSQIVQLLAISYRLPDLPLGFQARSVSVGPDGVLVKAAATSVELGQPAS